MTVSEIVRSAAVTGLAVVKGSTEKGVVTVTGTDIMSLNVILGLGVNEALRESETVNMVAAAAAAVDAIEGGTFWVLASSLRFICSTRSVILCHKSCRQCVSPCLLKRQAWQSVSMGYSPCLNLSLRT